jgi:hypothetical protein
MDSNRISSPYQDAENELVMASEQAAVEMIRMSALAGKAKSRTGIIARLQKAIAEFKRAKS